MEQKKNDLEISARAFADEKHRGQKRMNGEPYVNHPIRVAEIVKKYKKSHKIEELVAAALLHDTLEDTDTGINELREKFGETVTLLVIELTNDEKKKEELGKTKYLSEKLSSNNQIGSWALVIKLADRLDNVSDLANAKEEFRKRYILETEEIIKVLEKKRNLSETHRKLIDAIKKELAKKV